MRATLPLITSGWWGSPEVFSKCSPEAGTSEEKTILFLLNSRADCSWPEALNGAKIDVAYANGNNQMAAEIQARDRRQRRRHGHRHVLTCHVRSDLCRAPGGIPVVAWSSNGYGQAGAAV